jgi:hypothetical protein
MTGIKALRWKLFTSFQERKRCAYDASAYDVRTTRDRTGEQLGAADSDGAAVASYASRTRIVVCIARLD